MFKSLAIAVLPVVALAAQDGSNFDNAFETELFSSDKATILLRTYNSENKTANVDEFHGDLRITWGSDTNGRSKYANFGFCIENGDTYDCMSVNAVLDQSAIDANPTVATSFTITDGYYSTNTAIPPPQGPLPTADDSWEE